MSFFIPDSQKRKEFRKKYDFSHFSLVICKNRYKIKGNDNLIKIEFPVPCFLQLHISNFR